MPETSKVIAGCKEFDLAGKEMRGIKHNLYNDIIFIDNLFSAWKEFVRGKRSKRDVQEFELYLEDNIFLLHKQLQDNLWEHGQYQSFTVCDPKPRNIHKASVADRLVHHAVYRQLESLLDKSYIYDSWSCRLGKGTHKSICRCHKQLNKLYNLHNCKVWVLKCDIKKYFASINHDILLKLLMKKINDKMVIDLLKKIKKSFNSGLPLGNLTSQLFANVYLNPLDHYIKEKLGVKVYLRYCDDFLLSSHSRNQLEIWLKDIRKFLLSNLKLKLHPNKIKFRLFNWGIDWLGYVLYPSYINIRNKTRKRMWRNVNNRVNMYMNGLLDRDSLRSVFASYQGIIKYSDNREDGKRLALLYKIIS